MTDQILILVTCSEAQADTLATTLIEESLAACVNIISGVCSVYRWQDEVTIDREKLLIIKTHKAIWKTIEERISHLHSYETPEIISIPIEEGYPPYLNWINDSVSLVLKKQTQNSQLVSQKSLQSKKEE